MSACPIVPLDPPPDTDEPSECDGYQVELEGMARTIHQLQDIIARVQERMPSMTVRELWDRVACDCRPDEHAYACESMSRGASHWTASILLWVGDKPVVVAQHYAPTAELALAGLRLALVALGRAPLSGPAKEDIDFPEEVPHA